MTRRLEKMIELLVMSLILLLVNRRALLVSEIFLPQSVLGVLLFRELMLWLAVMALLLFVLLKHPDHRIFLSAWRSNWPLIAFPLVALLSALWSVFYQATFFKALVLLFATISGAYLGFRYRDEKYLNILMGLGIVLVVLNVMIVFAASDLGIMQDEPYTGSWRGIFWHKNHLGSIMALVNLLFLVNSFSSQRVRFGVRLLHFVFYALSLMLVVGSRSAAGLILVAVMHGSFILAYIWLKVAHRMRVVHYILALVLFAIGSLVLIFNLDFVFGLVNRSTTLTGRVPMWMYLIDQVISQRLWLGYGFGAVWSLDDFRLGVQAAVGWGYPVVIADNGFLDITLHLGIVGLILFIFVLGLMFFRAGKYAFQQRTTTGFVPLFILVFAVFANISFSLFMETEFFIWVLMVAGLFQTTPNV